MASSEKTEHPPAPPPPEEIKPYNVENEASQSHVHEVSTSVEIERSIPAVQTPVVPIQAPKISRRFAGKSREEVAAIRIQTTFRGYLVCLAFYTRPMLVTFHMFFLYSFHSVGFLHCC